MPKRANSKSARTKPTEPEAQRAMALRAGSSLPSRAAAPPAYPPIAQDRDPGALSPWPITDRFSPIVIGANLNLTYLSSVYRLATTGYRLQYVDLLNELLELDPHLYSVVSKRIQSVANGKITLSPFELSEDDSEFDKAQEVCDFVKTELARIPDMGAAMAALLWGVYYGLSSSEIMWSRDTDGWHVERLSFVHSRRLAYPDGQSWDLHIWDQGQVFGWGSPWGDTPSNSWTFGLRIKDYPGKFIVHAPQLRGDYPTREGLGREVGVWCLLKRVGGRGGADYLERFAKGFMDVSFVTYDADNPQGQPRPRQATTEDIATAGQIAAALGPGSGSYAVHPDSIKLEPKGYEGSGTAKVTWPEWIQLCDAQMSKAVLGGTLGTDVGKGGGNRALGEVQERGEADLEKFDAACLAETIKRDLVSWIVRLNMPEAMHLVPGVSIHLDIDPDPKAVVDLIDKLTLNGAPVDLDAECAKIGIALVPNINLDDKGVAKPRRSYRSDVVAPTEVDPDLLSEEAKQQQSDALTAQQDLAKIKAQTPVAAPPGQAPEGKPASGASAKTDEPAAKGDQDPTATKAKRVDDKGSKQKKGKGVAKLTDKVALDYDTQLDGIHRMLLADRQDAAPAQQAYDQLLEDYPARSLGWILSGPWRGPVEIPTEDIDFSEKPKWRAYKEQQEDPASIQAYVDRILSGKRKPVVLVKTPGKAKYQIVDGHHRTLAQLEMGWPVLAYVADMQVDDGPWVTLHGMQKSGSSRSDASYSREPTSWLEPDEIDDHA